MITVRRMEEHDIGAAIRLEADNFTMPWSEHAFLETLHCDYAYYYVAETENAGRKVIGICGLRNMAGEGEITNVVVDEGYRRKGIAEMMLKRVLAEGKELGIEAFTLEVRRSNQPAISLYEKFGFESVGVRKNFYERPREDALIMWKR